MKFEVHIRGPAGKQTREVELERDGTRWRVSLEGRRIEADAVEIAGNIFSIILDGQAHEIRVLPSDDGTLKLQAGALEFTAEISDPRAWRDRRHGHVEAEGRQQVVAPMPGKVVRVLVKVGDLVKAGQGLLVVEAMKMQNEIRSPKSGKIERLLVEEGQPVNAGQILISVD